RTSLYAVRTQVVPNERTNSLIVTATPETILLVQQVIEELDQPVEYQTTTYIFPVQNGQAADVANLLNQALRGGGGYSGYSSYSNRYSGRYGGTSFGFNRNNFNRGNFGGSSFRGSSSPYGSTSRPGGSFGQRRTRAAGEEALQGDNADPFVGAEGSDEEPPLVQEDEEEDSGRPATSRQFGGFRGGGGGFSVGGFHAAVLAAG
ncbi:MAG: secretin N-terminal domain-containing protein, partial [Armatimonadota bacterium]|nr:secretin N-terminal domain-containing protein [Armatimonadota bacterium]